MNKIKKMILIFITILTLVAPLTAFAASYTYVDWGPVYHKVFASDGRYVTGENHQWISRAVFCKKCGHIR